MGKNPNKHIRKALKIIAREPSKFMSYDDLKEMIERHRPRDSRVRAENISNHTLGHCLRVIPNHEKQTVKWKENGYERVFMIVRFT